MAYFVAPYYPEIIIEVKKASSPRRTRFKAAEKLANLLDKEKLPIKIPNGFSIKKLVELQEKDLMAEKEEKIEEAVKVLAKLSKAKQKLQELHSQSVEAQKYIELLFSDKKLSDDDFEKIKTSLQIIKEFGLASLRYREALVISDDARKILAETLNISGYTNHKEIG